MINPENKIHTFEELQSLYKTYIHSAESDALITKAYEFAKEKHKNQRRKSGDLYITHPVAVACILATLHSGPSTIIAGLLHDTIEDTDTSREEIAELFGEEIATLVESLTKITRLSDYQNVEFEAESHRKIFVAMAKDIRVIIIKLADRLHNMRTLQFQSEPKQKKIAKETLEVYAPIAHRLGIFTVKTELEDLSLYYLDHEKYVNIENLIEKMQFDVNNAIETIKNQITDILSKTNISFSITSRVKSIYSIYKKMYLKGKSFDEIYDILALRIITETEVNCYEILGYIHAYFKPVPGRFKDYIAMPKPNLYQSLHTTIVTTDGHTFEVQIRTKKMDETAESGVAAHWRYKEGANYDPKVEQQEIEEQLHWFRDFVSLSNDESDNESAKEYVDTLTHDIFDANVYVFTPKGKVISLPNGSTPIDFAYRIHTGIGDTLAGAKVNNKLVPLSTQLETGDVVEVKTGKNAHPTSEWLKICKSNFAKSKIKKYLLKVNKDYVREDNIEKGKKSLQDGLKERNINIQLSQITTRKVLDHFKCETADDFFVLINSKNLTPQMICDYLQLKPNVQTYQSIRDNINKHVIKSNSSDAVLLENGDTALISLANCCNPIPGDSIVGYITQGNGIKVHRTDCPNIKNESARLIAVSWNKDFRKEEKYPVDLALDCFDRNGLLVDIMNKLNYFNFQVFKLNAKMHNNGRCTISMTVMVKDSNELEYLYTIIKSVENVDAVTRIIH